MKQVEMFNREVLGVKVPSPTLVDDEEMRLSLHQLREEVDELELAHRQGDLVKIMDSLIDLDYFLHGVVYKHGVSTELYQEMFDVVHKRNMQKKQGVKENRSQFLRGDAIKSEGWVSPESEIQKILSRYE